MSQKKTLKKRKCKRCKRFYPLKEGFEVEKTGVFYCAACFEHIFSHGLGDDDGKWVKG